MLGDPIVLVGRTVIRPQPDAVVYPLSEAEFYRLATQQSSIQIRDAAFAVFVSSLLAGMEFFATIDLRETLRNGKYAPLILAFVTIMIIGASLSVWAIETIRSAKHKKKGGEFDMKKKIKDYFESNSK